jgi:hypothetical protein
MLTFVSTELAGALGTVADESRHSGAERKLGEICEHLVVATDADASVYDEDHIEGYSTSELFRTPVFRHHDERRSRRGTPDVSSATRAGRG